MTAILSFLKGIHSSLSSMYPHFDTENADLLFPMPLCISPCRLLGAFWDPSVLVGLGHLIGMPSRRSANVYFCFNLHFLYHQRFVAGSPRVSLVDGSKACLWPSEIVQSWSCRKLNSLRSDRRSLPFCTTIVPEVVSYSLLVYICFLSARSSLDTQTCCCCWILMRSCKVFRAYWTRVRIAGEQPTRPSSFSEYVVPLRSSLMYISNGSEGRSQLITIFVWSERKFTWTRDSQSGNKSF